MEGEAGGQVKGHERVFRERLAGGEEGFLGRGPQGEDIVGGGQGGEAVVLRGVGDLERAATEEDEVWGDGECLGFW